MASKTIHVTLDKATDISVGLNIDTDSQNSITIQFYPNGTDQAIEDGALEAIRKRMRDYGINATMRKLSDDFFDIAGTPAAPDKSSDAYTMLTAAFHAMKDVKSLTRRGGMEIEEALARAAGMDPVSEPPEMPFDPYDLLYRERTVKLGKVPKSGRDAEVEVLLSYYEGEKEISLQIYPRDTEPHIKEQIVNLIQQRLADHGISTESAADPAPPDDDEDDEDHTMDFIHIAAKSGPSDKPWESASMAAHAQDALQEVQQLWYRRGIGLYEALLEVIDRPPHAENVASWAALVKEPRNDNREASPVMTEGAAKKAILAALAPLKLGDQATTVADALSKTLGEQHRTRPVIKGDNPIHNRGTPEHDELFKLARAACIDIPPGKRAYAEGVVFDALHELYQEIETSKAPLPRAVQH